ncbi:MAG: ABC transporter substrate-binding protein [bacterium]|nr:ABC transporter substrate-binding protein [bacterium]
MLLLARLTLGAGEVAVLTSSKLEAYQKVVTGLLEILPSAQVFYLPESDVDQAAVIEQIRGRAPSAVLAVGAPAAALLKDRLRNVPLIYCMVSDPKRYNLAGENITGVMLKVRTEDQLETYKKTFPFITRLGLIYDPSESADTVAEARRLAKKYGFLLVERSVYRPEDIATAVKNILWEVDAIWLIPDRTVATKESFQYLLEATIDRKIPLLVFSEGFVKSGAILALAPDYLGIGRQVGQLTQKVIQGHSPAALPPLYAQGSLVINMHTAETLKIPISPETRKIAGRIY